MPAALDFLIMATLVSAVISLFSLSRNHPAFRYIVVLGASVAGWLAVSMPLEALQFSAERSFPPGGHLGMSFGLACAIFVMAQIVRLSKDTAPVAE